LVRTIGRRYTVEGSPHSAGLGNQFGGLVAGVASTAGNVATLAVSAPISIIDAQMREDTSEEIQSVVPGTDDDTGHDLAN
jgi:hypothetical protein